MAQAVDDASQRPHVHFRSDLIVGPQVQLLWCPVHGSGHIGQVLLQHVPLLGIPGDVRLEDLRGRRAKVAQLDRLQGLAVGAGGQQEVLYLDVTVRDGRGLAVHVADGPCHLVGQL